MGTYTCEGKTGDRYKKYKASYDEYRRKNRERINGLKKSRYDEYQTARIKWIKENRERWLQYRKNSNSKRRGLGFFQLNDSFDGSVGHHINQEGVIFIPLEVHASVKHNVFTGENMRKINELALNFLEKK